jgi:hypothetical protein
MIASTIRNTSTTNNAGFPRTPEARSPKSSCGRTSAASGWEAPRAVNDKQHSIQCRRSYRLKECCSGVHRESSLAR